tara:strand:- start:245 stop:922 length:678 start_codon:yes stop_codon:yes gene_type:complete
LKKIIIAIDGDSSSGKSTLAKALAKELSYKHINTGSMYRAVTLEALKNGLLVNNEMKSKEIIKMSGNLNFEFKLINNNSHLFLNGLNIEEEIRSIKVSDFVSQVSTISNVRKKIVEIQRKIGFKKGIVMEGRDIGSVVFPSAELKLFITAHLSIRAERRFNELKINNLNITKKSVLENLKKRDYIDRNRKHSPLIKVRDAILIDNSELSVFDQISLINNYLKKNL